MAILSSHFPSCPTASSQREWCSNSRSTRGRRRRNDTVIGSGDNLEALPSITDKNLPASSGTPPRHTDSTTQRDLNFLLCGLAIIFNSRISRDPRINSVGMVVKLYRHLAYRGKNFLPCDNKIGSQSSDVIYPVCERGFKLFVFSTRTGVALAA